MSRSSENSSIATRVAQERELTSINGEITNRRGSKIPLEDHGAMFGRNVFEGLRIIEGGILDHEEHRSRLYRSAQLLGIPMPNVSDYDRQLNAALKASQQNNGYIRVIRTSGVGELGVDPAPCHDPLLIFIIAPISLYPEDVYQRGVSLHTSAVRKTPYACLNCTDIKHGNYLSNGEAKREATMHGADDALMLTIDGYVSESSVANIFAVNGDTLFTPSSETNCLKGITKSSVERIALKKGLAVQHGLYDSTFFKNAEEIFLTGTGTGILPVTKIDDRVISDNKCGPVTNSLRNIYESNILSRCRRFED